MLVRDMELEDSYQVAAIEKENFSQPWSQKDFETAVASKDAIVVVAEEGDVQGYICMYISLDEAEITNVAVNEASRKKGVGTALMNYAFLRAGEAGVIRIFLEVRKSNEPAIKMYQKLGFDQIGIRKNFYSFPKEDAILMEVRLEDR